MSALTETLDAAPPTPGAGRLVELARSARHGIVVFAATLATALVLAMPIIFIAGSDPVTAYGALLGGSLDGQGPLSETLLSTTPLLLGGLAVAVAFQAGLFNIGVEGQLVLGGLLSAIVAIKLDLPPVVHVPFALLAGAIAGGLWASVPGALKAWRGIHEVITTIMMNFVAFSISAYLVKPGGALEGEIPTGTEPVRPSAELPGIWGDTRLHLGFVVALVAAASCWYLLYRTPMGYGFRMVGANPVAARFNGISSGRVTVQAMFLSGALAGLTGAVEVLGTHRRFLDSFSPGYGFDAIAVALLGLLQPIGVACAAFFFGMLRAGTGRLQTDADLTRDMITVIAGLVVACAAARVLIPQWQAKRRTGTEGGSLDA